MPKFVKSLTETSSKLQRLKTYNKVINNFVHGIKLRKVIDEEF